MNLSKNHKIKEKKVPKNCIFCKPQMLDIVHQTKHSLVVINLFPALAETNLKDPLPIKISSIQRGIQIPTFLIIPREHYDKQGEFPKDEWNDLSTLTADVVAFLSKNGYTDAYNFSFPPGHSMRHVPHYHDHIPALKPSQRLLKRIEKRPKIKDELCEEIYELFKNFYLK